MIYSSSKDAIMKNFPGCIEFQVNDHGDMDFTSFADEVQRKS